MVLTMTRDQLRKDRHRFGGNTLAVFKRDKYACTGCGMTMDQHVSKYGKRLTINHIDGSGRNKVHQPGEPERQKGGNNSMDNLETLCLPCHGTKDGMRTTGNQYGKYDKIG